MTKVALTSDWHGRLPDVPECDVLVVAGDICPDFIRPARKSQGWRRIDGGVDQARWLREKFVPHIAKQPVDTTLIIAGNHDFMFESTHLIPHDDLASADIMYLRDEAAYTHGLSFYGLPWVPNLASWAFYADSDALDQVYSAVPKETDVLITHGPPYGYGDVTSMRFASDPPDFDGHVGSDACLWAIQDKRPRVTVCGHIHEGAGHYRVFIDGHNDADLYNVAYVDERYNPKTEPVVIDL